MLSSTSTPQGFLTTDPHFCVQFKHVIDGEGGGVAQGGWWDRSWQHVVPGREPSHLSALEVLVHLHPDPMSHWELENRRRCSPALENFPTMASLPKMSFPSWFGALIFLPQ